MPQAIRLLNLGPTDSWRTQAVYHALAETMTADSPDTIIVCRPLSAYLCLGYHQIYEAVLDRAECERRGLPVFRRRVGGGATYLDADQLFYQCVFHHSRLPLLFREVYARILAAPVAALRCLGLKADLRAVNEIEANGRRIAGVGGGRIGQACVVVGNLLFDFDYETMARVWRAPWPSFRELAASALRERVTTLRRLIGEVSVEAVQEMLLEEFAEALGRPLESGRLSRAEADRARQVAKRLASAEYLGLHAENGRTGPMRSLKISAGVHIRAAEAEVNGHRLRASFRLRDDVIEAVRLESEPAAEWAQAEAALRGAPFKEWRQHLDEDR
ncbi:MAG: biotin/lipoate A/B protein ligase family protein [Anaerolineae bacterium]